TLPLHAIQIVVDHVVGSSRVRYDGVRPNSNEYRTLLRPLLWICHGFHAIAYPRYCYLAKLNFARLRSNSFATQNPPHFPLSSGYRLLYDFRYPTHHLARELVIELLAKDIYSGKALRCLSQAPYDGCAFPLVRRITFIVFVDTIYTDYEAHDSAWVSRMNELFNLGEDNATGLADIEDRTTDPLEIEANISSFVQRVKEMAPELGEIEVRLVSDTRPERTDRHVEELISQLFRLVSRVTYRDYDGYSAAVDLQINPVSNLVHIEHSSELIHTSFAQLVQRNSSTLRSLVIGNSNDIDLGAFMKTSDDTHITYPRLEALKLTGLWDYPELPTSAFKDVIPFPCLRSLSLQVCYPFDDDTLFRGNATTLTYLEMGLDNRTISILLKYNVFTQSSHPKLSYVNFEEIGDIVPHSFNDYADYVQFSLSIAPKAAARAIGGISSRTLLVPALPLLCDYACIQVLMLPYVCVDHWQVIALIKSLPLLSDLHAPPPSLGSRPTGIVDEQLPAYVISHYSPIGKRFRCWHLSCDARAIDLQGVIRAVLLLALVCPNFDCFNTGCTRRNQFRELMEVGIASDMFKEYAPRLRRLLFNAWRG
ncbi:hypothetical protein GGI08_000471, partial [Coemansia sp. S2]